MLHTFYFNVPGAGLVKTSVHGCVLLGYAVFGDTAAILGAKKVRPAVVMPTGHEAGAEVQTRP